MTVAFTRRFAASVVAFGLCGPWAVGLHAQPQPSPTPVTWELTFKPGALQRISVLIPGQSQSQTYWYMPYRVVNNTGQDVDFLPIIERVAETENEMPAQLASDRPTAAPRLTVEPAIVGLDPAVFKAIKTQHARTHPMMVEPVKVIGRILQGIDNSRDSVAVFKELDPHISRFTIYVGGLSGERQTVANPLYREQSAGGDHKVDATGKNAKEFVLQKTLAMPFTLPGDEHTRRAASAVLGRMTWVMR